jgi:hypothetical protein
MLEFEIRAFPHVSRPMSGLPARTEKIPLLTNLRVDSHSDSKMLEELVETA